MSLVKEFKEFALKGSVIDLSIGVVIGAAFGKVVTSFTEDILMPPISTLLGHHDFANSFVTLGSGHYETLAQAKAAGVATLNYGLFINTLINFLIVAFAIFLVVKRVNAMRRKPAAEAPNVKDCPQCLSTIPLKASRCKFCTAVIA